VDKRELKSATVIFAYEVGMAVWVFGPVRDETNTYAILTGVLVMHFVVGLFVPRFWVLLATLPPVIASAPLPRHAPDSDFTPLGAMVFVFLPMALVAMSAGVVTARIVRSQIARRR